jgi:uncharacterized caspase-like protein
VDTPAGRRVAFLIGNQNFLPDSELPPLHGPLNDIAALAEILGDPQRGAFDIRRFPDAASGEIKAAIEEELAGAGRGDLVLIHYAGHGKLDRAGNLCLATADTRARALHATSIPARHVRDLVANSDCDSVVLLLDCCFSGAATQDLRGDVASQLRSLQDASGFYILSASSEIQTAGEVETTRDGQMMGRFTAAIVEGLADGRADQDRDGRILLYDVVRHVQASVRHQTPQFLAARGSGDPLIAYSPATTRPLIDPGILADLASDNWRHRLGVVAHLVELARGSDAPVGAAAKDILRRHHVTERDIEVRRYLDQNKSAWGDAAPPSQPAPVPWANTVEKPVPAIEAVAIAETPAERDTPQPPGPTPKPFWRRWRLTLSIGVTVVAMLVVFVSQMPGQQGTRERSGEAPPTKMGPSTAQPQAVPPPVAGPQAPAAAAAARYQRQECGAILDRSASLEWYVGPDRDIGWQDAAAWAAGLDACGGGWSLPSTAQVAGLFDATQSAGTGYRTQGRSFPARIDPVFARIGGGSWVWVAGGPQQGRAPAFNLNQNKDVVLSADGSEFPTRAFAVRPARQ